MALRYAGGLPSRREMCHCLTLVLFAASSALVAQTMPRPAEPMLSATAAGVTRYAPKIENPNVGPFSRLALGGGISPLGINLQAAVNVNRYINLRGVGN